MHSLAGRPSTAFSHRELSLSVTIFSSPFSFPVCSLLPFSPAGFVIPHFSSPLLLLVVSSPPLSRYLSSYLGSTVYLQKLKLLPGSPLLVKWRVFTSWPNTSKLQLYIDCITSFKMLTLKSNINTVSCFLR